MYNLYSQTQPTKRNVFFSFHYDDIMRVNNVRMSGQFKTESTTGTRNIEGYYDYSLWESRKTTGPDSVKTLIRDGVDRTSAVCVLIGTDTWRRRWVRYEIARSVIDGRGLLGVHINGLKHHKPPYQPHQLGENPMRYLGIYKAPTNGNFYIAELKHNTQSQYQWFSYDDYSLPINVPKYMPPPVSDVPTPLSDYVKIYDWMQSGHNLIGTWIDGAAQAAGR